jgi:hypothetical protein
LEKRLEIKNAHHVPEVVLKKGAGQDAPALMNGLRKCGIYTQWNFMQP